MKPSPASSGSTPRACCGCTRRCRRGRRRCVSGCAACVHRLHQQARGVRLEPLTPAAQEEPLSAHLDFDDPVGDSEALLFFGKQLLDPLLAKLHARGEALLELVLTMETTPAVSTT